MQNAGIYQSGSQQRSRHDKRPVWRSQRVLPNPPKSPHDFCLEVESTKNPITRIPLRLNNEGCTLTEVKAALPNAQHRSWNRWKVLFTWSSFTELFCFVPKALKSPCKTHGDTCLKVDGNNKPESMQAFVRKIPSER